MGFCRPRLRRSPGASELDADEVAGVFAGAAGDGTLVGDDAVGHDLAGDAEFAGGFFEEVAAAVAAQEEEAMADVGEGHGGSFSR